MADISFVDSDSPSEEGSVDSFVDFSKEDVKQFAEALLKKGVVTNASDLEERTVRPEGVMTEFVMDHFEVQHGTFRNDYVFNIRPIKNTAYINKLMKMNRDNIILAIVHTIKPYIPDYIKVDIIEPNESWDFQLWTIKIKDAKLNFGMDLESMSETAPENIVVAFTETITGKK